MFKKISFIIFVLLFLSTTVYASPAIKSPSSLLMDSTTGQILYGTNENQKYYPASTTKILTALIALEKSELDEIVTISKNVPYSIEKGSSQIYLIPDEKLTMEQLFYALLVESANDAAVAIAEHIAGSEEDFVKMMNEKAETLGALNSNFTNSHGLHSTQHYTTAYDMVLITREAMKNQIFRKVVMTLQYTIPETNKQQTRYLYNKNKLIKENSEYYYENCIGIKTGYTNQAKNTIVSGINKDGKELITIVLNANGAECYTDTIALLDYGLNNFEWVNLIEKREFVKEILFEDVEDKLQVIAEDTVKYVKSLDNTNEIKTILNLNENIDLPVNEGQKLGTISFYLDDDKIGETNLIAENNIKKPKRITWNLLKNIFKWIVIILLILYIIARIFVQYKNIQIRKRKALKRKRLKKQS